MGELDAGNLYADYGYTLLSPVAADFCFIASSRCAIIFGVTGSRALGVVCYEQLFRIAVAFGVVLTEFAFMLRAASYVGVCMVLVVKALVGEFFP